MKHVIIVINPSSDYRGRIFYNPINIITDKFMKPSITLSDYKRWEVNSFLPINLMKWYLNEVISLGKPPVRRRVKRLINYRTSMHWCKFRDGKLFGMKMVAF